MVAIAAVFSKSIANAPRLVGKMLHAMQHRGRDGMTVAWEDNLESNPAPDSISVSKESHSSVGYCFTRILPNDVAQPIRVGEGWLCLAGRILADNKLVGGEEAARFLSHRLEPDDFSGIQSDTGGAYSICYCKHDGLLVTRDPIGLKSLFIGRRDDLIAVASDRKALWAIGITEARTFLPGGFLRADRERIVVQCPGLESRQAQRSANMSVGSDEVLQSLIESVTVQTTGLGKLAIGFSGGLDSTLLAKIAKDVGAEPLLVTVGLGRTPEMIQAESTAKDICLPIVASSFSIDDVKDLLDRVLWLIEEPDLMKVSIAMAVHLTARVAQENGRSILMLGQGSDELFGGYKRFATILGESGAEGAVEAILESVRNACEVNYQRDDQAVSSFRTELRLPFATRRLVELASRMPLSMKVRSSSDNVRKWVLREAAVKLGLPSALAMRPKKAIQHASGIEKAIRKISTAHGTSASVYLAHRLEIAKKNLEHP